LNQIGRHDGRRGNEAVFGNGGCPDVAYYQFPGSFALVEGAVRLPHLTTDSFGCDLGFSGGITFTRGDFTYRIVFYKGPDYLARTADLKVQMQIGTYAWMDVVLNNTTEALSIDIYA
jgi:hypothetical protein